MKKTRFLAVVLAILIALPAFSALSGLFVPAVAEEYVTGDLVEFGSYPQTLVTDAELIDALGAVETEWVSYGYYSGNGMYGLMKQGDYMRYTDVELDGSRFRGVVCDSYRPVRTTDKASADKSYQDENGYETGKVYWFRYEPIVWRYLYTTNSGDGLLLSESIIDAQPYSSIIYKNDSDTFSSLDFDIEETDGNDDPDRKSAIPYACNYNYSSIREWLNGTFYDTAFDADEKAAVYNYLYTNKAYDPVKYSRYNFENSRERVFLPSFADITCKSYGFSANKSDADTARTAAGTDYAKAQGLYVSVEQSTLGLSVWWLRSAAVSSSDVCVINYRGTVGSSDVCHSARGVRPCVCVANPGTLKRHCEHEYGEELTYDREKGVFVYVCEKCFETKTEKALQGDVDLDGEVTAGDARLALRASVGLEELKEGTKEFLLADINGSSTLTADDARNILRISVGLEIDISVPENPEEPEEPTEETPSEETPSEEIPSEETPSEETPSEETPSEETPSEETPSEETPSEETPSEETPSEEPSSEETPSEEPSSEETPSEETPSEETPSEETSSEETPSEETPSEETPSEEPSSEETPSEDPTEADPVELPYEESGEDEAQSGGIKTSGAKKQGFFGWLWSLILSLFGI